MFFHIYGAMHSSLQSNFSTFLLAQKETPYPLAITPRPPTFSQLLATTNLFHVAIDLFNLDISCEQNCAICGFLCMALFIQYKVFKAYPCCIKYRCFVYFINELFSLEWIYHILFICSSIGGHLSCDYFLAVRNNVAINIWVKVFLRVYIFVILESILNNGIFIKPYV